jgi:hypothetical protein
LTVRFSSIKIRKILRGYFQGLPQTVIAGQSGVNQGSISHYAGKFKMVAADHGIAVAGKEYLVMDEVDALRSLAVELTKSKLSVEDTKQGHIIIKAFFKLGVCPEQHLNLVDVCRKIEDPGFIASSLKLCQAETSTGMGYQEIVSRLEKAQEELPELEKQVDALKKNLKSLKLMLEKKNLELSSFNKKLENRKDEIKAEAARMEQELAAKMNQFGVMKKEVEDAAALKTEIAKSKLTLSSLIKLAKEYIHANK